jgi:hypothetical protein
MGGATATVKPGTATPSEPQTTPIPPAVVIVPLPNENGAGLAWDRAIIDNLSVEVPSEASGWRLTVVPDNTLDAPYTVQLVNADASAMVIVDPRNGDTYWRQLFSGSLFREYKVRTSNGTTQWQAGDDELKAFHPGNAEIVSHVINSIKIEALPTTTPSPTMTPTRTADIATIVPTP